MDKKEIQVALLRRPDGIHALQLRRRVPFVPPRPGSDGGSEPSDPYEEFLSPLEASRVSRKLKRELTESWTALGNVRRLDGETLFHLVRVLLHTLPDTADDRPVPPLALEPEPPKWRPTAANPRAYKGTKDRPPKSGRPEVLNLHPHLANARDVNLLLRELAPHQESANELLIRDGIVEAPLPPLVDGKGRVLDITLWALDREGRELPSGMPPLFVRYFLQWMRLLAREDVGRVLSIYWSLGLDKDPPLRRAVSGFVADTRFSGFLDWCGLIVEQTPERRPVFVELLTETRLGLCDCTPEKIRAVRRVAETATDANYAHRMHVLLDTLRGGSTDYLLGGFALADRFKPEHVFETPGTCPSYPARAVEELFNYVGEEWFALQFWEGCGRLEGLAGLAETLPWRKADRKTASSFFWMLRNGVSGQEDDVDFMSDRWSVIVKHAPRMFECILTRETEFREKAVDHFKEILWYCIDPGMLDLLIAEYLDLVPRLCAPPLSRDARGAYFWAALTSVGEREDWFRIAKAPVEVFRAMEEAAERENDAALISFGMHYTAHRQGAELVGGLLAEPRAVLKAMKALGGVGRSLRREALSEWKHHPFLRGDLEDMDGRGLAGLVADHLPAGMTSPVPRKLREWAEGKGELTPAQVERGRREVLSRLVRTRWELLGRLCMDRVARTLRTEGGDRKVDHAIRMYGSINHNRKALRNFLRAHFAGDRDYLRNHPVNRRWLEGLRRADREVWVRGMTRGGVLDDGTPVKLHIEPDPLEGLRLGTYVGSCTGLGGSFSDSAAAVVLDANKHVVYARTREGRVVGRQLIALSDAEELVVFGVYPANVPGCMEALFRDFDVAFARKLGVRVYSPGGDGRYTIRNLLSREWWDDGAWDMDAEADPAG